MLVAFFKAAIPLLRRGAATAAHDDNDEMRASSPTGGPVSGFSCPAPSPNEGTPASSSCPPSSSPPLLTAAEARLRVPASIIVTLFDGPPYTLWNVRDLARHAGLRVERSFAFRASVYRGYRHARTLGDLKTRVKGAARREGEEHGEEEVKEEKEVEEEEGGKEEGKEEEEEEEEAEEEKEARRRVGAWRGEERSARSYVFVLPPPPRKREARRNSNAGPKRKRSGDTDDDDDER